MATTMFFEGTVKDKVRESGAIELEFGRSSFYDGKSLMYLKVDDKLAILDEKTGRAIYDAMQKLGTYLGYDK
jgi:hypothetical protein